MENVSEQARVFSHFAEIVEDKTIVDEVLETTRIGKTGHYRVLSREGLIYYDFDKSRIEQTDADKEYFQKIINSGSDQGYFEYTENGRDKALGYFISDGLILVGTVDLIEIQQEAQTVLYPILISVGLLVLLSIVISLYIAGRITKPIKELQSKMKQVEEGDLSVELESEKQDEVGQLAISANNMKNSIRAIIEQVADVSGTVANKSDELTQSTTEVKSGSEQTATTMHELATGAEEQAEYTSELSDTMKTFLNEINELNTKGESIQESSKNVLSLSEQGQKLMNTSVKQMVNIEKIVKDSVEKVRGLDNQSQEISKLVSVIQDIAEQTNLLALNAAIEAARAGEQGKGFAVVADEVRKLAEQVTTSVTDITSIVNNIQTESTDVTKTLESGFGEVEQGSLQIRTTGETFEDINGAIMEMVDTIKDVTSSFLNISDRSQQMSGTVEEIAAISEESAAGIEQTSASAQQTSSSMEEVAKSCEDLSKLADDLNKTIVKFKM